MKNMNRGAKFYNCVNQNYYRPEYVPKEEWENLPKDILMRRISYQYQTKGGLETAILYTTIIALFCLIKRGEFSTDGLQAEIERLKGKIRKHILPKHQKQRHYPRKTKKGKYQKYA